MAQRFLNVGGQHAAPIYVTGVLGPSPPMEVPVRGANMGEHGRTGARATVGWSLRPVPASAPRTVFWAYLGVRSRDTGASRGGKPDTSTSARPRSLANAGRIRSDELSVKKPSYRV